MHCDSDLKDVVMPLRTRRPDPSSPIPPSDSGLPTDGSNPMLQGYPSADKHGTMTGSTASPDTTTPQRGTRLQERASTRNEQNATIQGTGPPSQQSRSPHAELLNIMQASKQSRRQREPSTLGTSRFQPGAASRPREVDFRARADQADEAAGRVRGTAFARGEQKKQNATKTMVALERQMSRNWRPGDVYSPRDLSPAEQMKARTARQPNSRFRMQTRARSRNEGGADAFDVLRLDPVKEYKNYTMMGEFVTEMGRIKGARETGLRAVNQRKLAKAVRRSVGMGLIPSVHPHPELLPERIEQRDYVWSRNSRNARSV